jgi:hypothetical protein
VETESRNREINRHWTQICQIINLALQSRFTLGLGAAGIIAEGLNLLSPPKAERFIGSELREKVRDESSDLNIFTARRVCYHISNFSR